MELKKGILIQGPITDWTEKIIIKHKQNFPDYELLLSTWTTENIENISCDVVQIDPPKIPSPIPMTINHQILGTLAGLRKIKADIIMKCRTDQFIHNKNIFELFMQNCSNNKIMIPNYTTVEAIDYLASDLCQIATKENLVEFWESIPLYDGINPFTHTEIYLTMHYILHAKNDLNPWSKCLKKYFYVIDFEKDFQIKWEKLENQPEPYQRWFKEWYPKCVKSQLLQK